MNVTTTLISIFVIIIGALGIFPSVFKTDNKTEQRFGRILLFLLTVFFILLVGFLFKDLSTSYNYVK